MAAPQSPHLAQAAPRAPLVVRHDPLAALLASAGLRTALAYGAFFLSVSFIAAIAAGLV